MALLNERPRVAKKRAPLMQRPNTKEANRGEKPNRKVLRAVQPGSRRCEIDAYTFAI